MAKKKKIKWLRKVVLMFGIILLGAGSWALYSLINEGASDLLGMAGLENEYLKLLAIIIVVVIGLALISGVGILKVVEKMVKE